MGIIDIVVFVAFVAAVLFVGLYKSKGEDTHGEEGAADYFLAGRGLTWWLIGFSLIAANISAEQFVGMSGQGAGLYGANGRAGRYGQPGDHRLTRARHQSHGRDRIA